MLRALALSTTLVALATCGPNDSTETTTTTVTPSSGAAAALTVPQPTDNPSSEAKVQLGRLLFWDPILSGDRDVACATCHHPDFAYTDARVVSIGVGGTGLGPRRVASSTSPHRTTRNAMTVLNAAFNGADASTAPMFWDNRTRALEGQARGPMHALDEMRGAAFTDEAIAAELVARVSAIDDYAQRFAATYGVITETTIVQAIAAFERTLTSTDTSFDRNALSAAAQRGLTTLRQHGCTGCHSGPMFSDFQLHQLGVPDGAGLPHDVGDGQNRFRTGSWRNLARTAPYMHAGQFASLDQVFAFYARVDRRLDPRLANLRPLDAGERTDAVAFFSALSDGTFDVTVPASVPSGLPVGGSIH